MNSRQETIFLKGTSLHTIFITTLLFDRDTIHLPYQGILYSYESFSKFELVQYSLLEMDLLTLEKNMEDDRSSVSSFAVVADSNNKKELYDDGNKSDTTEIDFGESAMNRNINLSSQQQSSEAPYSQVIEVAKVGYRDLLISIFIRKITDNEASPTSRRFYFEPLAFLDPKSIVVTKSHDGLFNQGFVRLTVQMWNAELRSKVLDRLRSLPSFNKDDIQEDDVCVMPFEDVKLVCKTGGPQSVRLMDQPSSYLRSRENLNFYFLCDLPSTATALADDFKKNPEFILERWQLALECGGLALGISKKNPQEKSLLDPPKVTFNVSTTSSTIGGK